MKRKEFLILVLLGFGLIIRLYRLDYRQGQFIFDEAKYYHRAAQTYLTGTDDPNFEHPPLAKELMALSLKIFGDNPQGLRMPSLVFSLFGNLIIYLFIRDLFQNKTVGLLTTILLSFDFMYFIHARLGTPEAVFLGLSWAAMYFFWRHFSAPNSRNLWTSLMIGSALFGLALGAKWTALLVLIPFVVISLIIKSWRRLLTFLAVLPLAALPFYLFTYLPYLTKHSLTDFLLLQQKMFFFWASFSQKLSLNLSPTQYLLNHAPAWLLNPGWAYDSFEQGTNTVQVVWAMYHPLIFFVSLFFFLRHFWEKGLRFNEGPLAFANLTVLGFFVPWLLVSRIQYTYYFLPAIPFLYAFTAAKLEELSRKDVWLFTGVLLTIFLSFLYFYPLLTSLPVPTNYLLVTPITVIKN